jgi:aminoglycoside 3-N-acetyltransferase
MTLADALADLGVPQGGVLYVHSSLDWLATAGIAAGTVLPTLREWVGAGGTLIMPVYPCRTLHLEYLRGQPVYNVRTTPSAVGLISELFRRTDGVVRSLDPDFCIAALGPEAAVLTATDGGRDPFGPSSVYARLIARGATLVGLGVSLNTNSFIHVIDSRLATLYPRSPYDAVFAASVVDYAGVTTTAMRAALAPQFQQLTRPAAVAEVATPDSEMFASRVEAGTQFFRWDLARWAGWCEDHGRSAVAAGQWPCWLSRLAEGPAA